MPATERAREKGNDSGSWKGFFGAFCLFVLCVSLPVPLDAVEEGRKRKKERKAVTSLTRQSGNLAGGSAARADRRTEHVRSGMQKNDVIDVS